MKDRTFKGKLFSIGEAAKLGNVTKRTLRYYEKFELVKPDFVDVNGYRYYSLDTILKISIIKYFKLMDFTLEDIKEQLSNSDYSKTLKKFDRKLAINEKEMSLLLSRQRIVNDWRNLLEEAYLATNMKLDIVNVKYIGKSELIKYPMVSDFNYKSSILDLEFNKFVESEKNWVTGPVMFYYEDLKERVDCEIKGKELEMLYIQRAVKPIDKSNVFSLDASLCASIYHFGSYSTILDTYDKLLKWEEKSEHKFLGPVVERFVVDYWSTFNEEKFVTELIVPIHLK